MTNEIKRIVDESFTCLKHLQARVREFSDSGRKSMFAESIQTLYEAENSQTLSVIVVALKSFLLVKTKPGKEKEILERFKTLPEVREIHLITGKFDLLVELESEETELDPRQKIAEVVMDKVRKAGGIVDTRTIIPIEAESKPPQTVDRPTAKGFVFVKSDAGKTKELMRKLLELPEVRGVYMLFGKADVLAELEVEKSYIHPPPQHIASLVETRIAKLGAVHDTDTFVPLESIVK